MAREVTELVRDTENSLLFNHSSRVYYFSAATGKRKGLTFDPELLYVSAMFHDMGLTPIHSSATDRFEVDGANTAREFLRQHKIPQQDIDTVWLRLPFTPRRVSMDAWRRVAPLHSTQPPYNIFEREIQNDVLPYALEHKLLVLSYGAICRGLLSGKMRPNRKFDGDDLRLSDLKFQQPRFIQYLKAADRLGQHAWENHGKSLLAFAIRWILDRGENMTALWGARNAGQLDEVEQAFGWKLSSDDYAEVDRDSSREKNPVGPEFMAPPPREHVAV
jgi:hypothetical protein